MIRTDPCRNEVVVGAREDAIGRKFQISGINRQGARENESTLSGFVKIRSSGHPAGPATLSNGIVSAECDLFGIAPGQSAVLYSSDGAILCGGTIEKRI